MEPAEQSPVELIWWGLHEAVRRNHNCKELDELLPIAESYLLEKQPLRLKLGADYHTLESSPP